MAVYPTEWAAGQRHKASVAIELIVQLTVKKQKVCLEKEWWVFSGKAKATITVSTLQASLAEEFPVVLWFVKTVRRQPS